VGPHPLGLAAIPALVLGLAGCAGVGPIGAHDRPAPDPALSRCEPELAARLRFLEPELASNAQYARRWWWAWNGVYAGGIVYGSARAATRNGRGDRANEGVNAVKSAIGLSRNLIWPAPALEGAEDLRSIDPSLPGACAERLARAEERLKRAAEDSREERRTWLPHLANLALNLAGALVVAEGFDEGTGYSSGVLGILMGELHIWTHPWQAESTLEEYRERFRSNAGRPAWRTEEIAGREVLILE
jgi:hypothetical protein